MTRDEIEKMANDFWRARGMKRVIFEAESGIVVWSDFAAEVAAKVVEDCAKVADGLNNLVPKRPYDTRPRTAPKDAMEASHRIRALSPDAKEQG